MLFENSNFYKTSTNLLKTYSWDLLFNILIDEKVYSKLNNLEKEQATVLKALLLSAWWQEHSLAKSILLKSSKEKSDYLIYFATTLSWMSIGESDYINYYLKNLPNKLPNWMKTWIEIEFYGRSMQDKIQIQKIRKFKNINKNLPTWAKVALLQSLNREEKEINIHYLSSYLKEFKLCNNNNLLDNELCINAKLFIPNENNCNIESFLSLNSYAKYLLSQHKVVDALIIYDRLSKTKFLDLNAIDKWLAIAMSIPQGLNALEERVDFALTLVPNSIDITRVALSYGLIESWSTGKFTKAYALVKEFYKYHRLPLSNLTKNSQVFFIYVLKLCTVWQKNRIYYDITSDKHSSVELIILGESHSLSPANLYFNFNGKLRKGHSKFVAGIKMYNLLYPDASYYTNCLIEHIKKLPSNCDILICIGEIDTRPNGGIWKYVNKNQLDINNVIEKTVAGYILFLVEQLMTIVTNSITIQGIPAPGYELVGDKDPVNKEEFLNMIKIVNEKLKIKSIENGFNFLDVYSATVGNDGKGNGKWHLDDYHLTPLFYTQADKWLIKP